MTIKKENIRKQAKEILKKTRGRYQNQVILNQLRKEILRLKAKCVLLYCALSIEVNLRPLITELRALGIRVFVPLVRGEAMQIVPYRLPLVEGSFGVLEPKTSSLYKSPLQCAVVPIVATDCQMRRIGYGKGYYDRFFEQFSGRPYVIFVQKRLCMAYENITESWDIVADLICTPQVVIKRRKNGFGVDKPHCFRIIGSL
ncbi:5-formyltetrahydrofolate cyclo-ligase [Helicobacter enhydrae]|uniref:5-formyltetrahydrofolate cyclo-ligase n=1 Tax=Helicobacter enhydrae TaxID=222136 RepID=A0A1B1U733_9HELI|nr:5-formyltetrahydrofolate cyclo-ligase [Helicobacter enhydrae]ANV98593.1 5-formyltetrahydrofolate cyclo-ligase [Helicobacter enhydrae]